MFYAGLDENTAVLETVSREDRKKNNISIGEFETLENFHIIDFTKLSKILSIFAVNDKENYYLKQFLHSFVRDITQQIHKNGKEHTEYVPTQIVTEFLKYPFNKNRKHNSSVFFWDNELSVKKVKLISIKKEIVK